MTPNLNGKLLIFLQPEYNTPLWTIVRFTEGKWKLKLHRVLQLWISLFDRNKLLFSATNISIEYMYWGGRVSISNSLKRFLQDCHLDLLVRILITLFCILKMLLTTQTSSCCNRDVIWGEWKTDLSFLHAFCYIFCYMNEKLSRTNLCTCCHSQAHWFLLRSVHCPTTPFCALPTTYDGNYILY